MRPNERYAIRWNVLLWTLSAPLAMLRSPAEAFQRWRHARPPGNPGFPADELIAIADEILLRRFAGRLIFRTRCLKRTLVIWRLLRAHGHDPHAVIGLDREGRKLAGHAWIEIEGRRLADPVFSPPRDFVPFLSIGDRTVALTGAETADGNPSVTGDVLASRPS